MKKYIYFHVATIGHWREVVLNIVSQILDSGLFLKIDEIRCSVVGDVEAIKSVIPINILHKFNFIVNLKNELCMATNWMPPRRMVGLPVHNEQPMAQHIYKTCQEEDCYILYLHSKGVKNSNEEERCNIRDAVNFVLHFLLYRHEDVFYGLKDNDAVGCNLYHFSSWVKNDYRSVVKEKYKGYKCKEAEDLYWQSVTKIDQSVDITNHLRCWYILNFWWSKSSHIRSINPKFFSGYSGPEVWITQKGKMFELKNSKIHDHRFESYGRSNYINSELELKSIDSIQYYSGEY